MSHLADMRGRLPQLYRDGELVGQVLGVPGLQVEVLDEEGIEVRRAHWFDSALSLDEAARLAALLGIAPEPWHNLREYRPWVHALRDAILARGAVTPDAIQGFVAKYARDYQSVAGILATPPIERWSATRSTREAAFIENPARRRGQRIPATGGIEPLHQFAVEQQGLDETFAELLLTGLPAGPESAPVIVNLTTGEALIFLGDVPPGQRLWISANFEAEGEGRASAFLEQNDVSDRLRSVRGVVPGTPWEAMQVDSPARPLRLARGRNELWFLPVAHFDTPGLDRFLLALADIALMQGRYDQTLFDQSVFYQDPAVNVSLSWLERTPATFHVELPGGVLRNQRDETVAALDRRDELETLLDLAVRRLRAAGVDSTVSLEPFEETQPQRDYLTAILPVTVSEVAPVGADRLPDAGGVFNVTQFDQSTYR